MDEKELFQSIREGDVRAFEILFHQYYGILCAFAQKMLQNPEVAEDIVQEIFTKLWIEREYIQIELSLKAFLVMV
jgi:RNA polymerase sigma-70 factor, ECF subfamily